MTILDRLARDGVLSRLSVCRAPMRGMTDPGEMSAPYRPDRAPCH
jgi:hypothetical protein